MSEKAEEERRKMLEEFEEKIIMDSMRGEVNREVAEMIKRQLERFQMKLRALKEMKKTIKLFKALSYVGAYYKVNAMTSALNAGRRE